MSTQNTSSIISSVYNSRKNLLELMESQNYKVDDYSNFSINEVNAMCQNNQLDMLLEKKVEDPDTKRKNKVYIRYYLAKTLRPNNLQEMIDDLFNLEEVLKKEDTLLIISKDELNDTLKNELKHIWEKEQIFINIINLKRLQFNILNHHLVPPHRIMSNAEEIEIMKRYNINYKEQFPDISRFDPVAQAIGLRPNQVCEIKRPSKSAVEAFYYRVCV